jgi:hypothetical protein
VTGDLWPVVKSYAEALFIAAMFNISLSEAAGSGDNCFLLLIGAALW